VATCGRNLSFCLRDMGAGVGVLYGSAASTLGMNSLIREIAFFDPSPLHLCPECGRARP